MTWQARWRGVVCEDDDVGYKDEDEKGQRFVLIQLMEAMLMILVVIMMMMMMMVVMMMIMMMMKVLVSSVI